MAKCQWKSKNPNWENYECPGGNKTGLELFNGKYFCILHNPDSNKNNDTFREVISRKLKEKDYDFRGVIFPDGCAKFSKHKFDFDKGTKEKDKKIIFAEAQFLSEASFWGATFGGEANFGDAKFGGEASFWSAKFGGEADFFGATFIGEAGFSEATFIGKATFRIATFNNKALFHNTEFRKDVDFCDATFNGEVDFMVYAFSSSNIANFCDANFHKPEQSKFHTVSLEMALFADADIERVRFTDVKWHKIKGRNAIYDEEISDEYPLIAQTYRRLMKNYENAREYSIAGDFYIGAMEMDRKNLETKLKGLKWTQKDFWKTLGHYIVHNLYRFISYYGESYWWAFGWLILILLVGGMPDYRNLPALLFSGVSDHRNLLLALLLLPFSREFWLTVVLYIHAALLPSVLALFLLALKRRFRR